VLDSTPQIRYSYILIGVYLIGVGLLVDLFLDLMELDAARLSVCVHLRLPAKLGRHLNSAFGFSVSFGTFRLDLLPDLRKPTKEH